MLEIILSLWKIPIARQIAYCLIALIVLGSLFGYLSHRRNVLERELERERRERNRIERKNEGLQILVNTENSAAETERLRENANVLQNNSNNFNFNFNNAVRRDSNAFSGNFAESRARFCRNFPLDSACR